MWRPNNWPKLLEKAKQGINFNDVDYETKLVEAGADALLDALFELAQESPTKTFTIDSRVVQIFKES